MLYIDGDWLYTDGAPGGRHTLRFQQRADKQITSLEILAIAVGLSTFEVELAGRKVVLWSDNSGAEARLCTRSCLCLGSAVFGRRRLAKVLAKRAITID